MHLNTEITSNKEYQNIVQRKQDGDLVKTKNIENEQVEDLQICW